MTSRIDTDKVTQLATAVSEIPNWFSSVHFNKHATLFGWRIQVKMRSADGLMGRFGAGWNWKVGIQFGGRTMLLSLLVMDFSVHRVSVIKEE